jgi:PleD family two-component response regulator
VNKTDKKYEKIQTFVSGNESCKPNILIVDDHPESLRLLSQILSKRGYKVRPTRDGKMALNFACSTPPDLILLDIMMPGMDGYQVCEQLKACAKTKDIPVIFISGLNEVFDKVKAFSLGAVDYIAKSTATQSSFQANCRTKCAAASRNRRTQAGRSRTARKSALAVGSN